jgi:hypothetical protein
MRTPEYQTWANIIKRCTNPKTPNYRYYGGRGIAICSRWRDSFQAFLADMGRRPSPRHSIDRYPNNDGHYEPGNCRWATAKEQRQNQRPRPPRTRCANDLHDLLSPGTLLVDGACRQCHRASVARYKRRRKEGQLA